jgi:asparagine synthetase B (glutamine-hydrolysing)
MCGIAGHITREPSPQADQPVKAMLAALTRRGSLAQPLRDAAKKQWVPGQLWRLLVLEHWLRRNRGRQPLAAAAEARNASPKSAS